jgi:TRAP-type C4-dicarboxylate transport system permease small subunit
VSVGQRDHISVTVLIDKLPISFKLIVDVLVLALVALLNAAMVWYSLTVWVPITGRFIMPALQLPQVYAQLSVPIGCSLAVLYCLLSILDVVDGFTQKNTVS